METPAPIQNPDAAANLPKRDRELAKDPPRPAAELAGVLKPLYDDLKKDIDNGAAGEFVTRVLESMANTPDVSTPTTQTSAQEDQS